MRTLYHLPISPFSRKVRLVLNEKKLEAKLIVESPWKQRQEFLRLNPTGEVPVLIDGGAVLSNSVAICEYLEEVYPDESGWSLLGKTPVDRAETRRLVGWFDVIFNREVTKNILYEKVLKRLYQGEGPAITKIREGQKNLSDHLDYISWLMETRKWLAGDQYSFADITAAAHISSLDYLGEIPWHKYKEAKDWYARVKSRPSFRSLLKDKVPGIMPVADYVNLDF